MDMISELPDFIVDHILSFVNDPDNGYPAFNPNDPDSDASPSELVRMSVLSKKWFHLTASFPILDFRIYHFRSRQSFYKYVEYTASRFCQQDVPVPAHKLKLVTSIAEPAELDTIDRCLGLLLVNGVKNLVIHIANLSDVPRLTELYPTYPENSLDYRTKVGNMDMISELPDFIVDHILSFVNDPDNGYPAFNPNDPDSDASPSELVRMSVLSKKWFHLTASFPILDFRIYHFRSRQSFYKYVEYTTSRFCQQDVPVPAHKLKLVTSIAEPAEFDIIDRCLGLLLVNGVKNLMIHIADLSGVPRYRLPNMLLSVSVLTSLTISGCDLPSSFILDVIKFKSLVRLELENIYINDEAIKYFTTSCPLLQVFNIDSCHGFKTFCVYGHQSLQMVSIECNTQVERIDIEAPNLYILMVVALNARGAPRMNLASCKKLTTLIYNGHPFPNSNDFSDFLSNIPSMENLVLIANYNCNKLKLSSHSLRTLMLDSVFDFEEIEFSCPNLVSFCYPCDGRLLERLMVDEPLLKDSNHLKACMRCYPDDYIGSRWFRKLRWFLDKRTGFKVLNLYINATYSEKFTKLKKLKAIELPPYELEHVELQLEINEESLAHIAFVEAVLWCCRPRSLTLRSSFPLTDFEEQSDVVKFTYAKLLQQEDQDHTSIQIISPSSSFLMALSGEGRAISFTKEEVPQDEAGSQRFAGLEIF